MERDNLQLSPLPVQRSLLSPAGLRERVLNDYELVAPITCEFWYRGINDSYLVQAGDCKLVLRVCPAGWRSFKQLAAEIELLNYLHQRQIRVPRPISQKDGTYIQTLPAPEGQRYAVLFSFVPGSPHSPSPQNSFRFGQAIAQLHTVTDVYPAGRGGMRFDPADMVDKPLALLEPHFAEHQADWAYLQGLAADLNAAVGQLPHQTPQYGLCHGDVNDGNLHLGQDGQWALLDFEYFGTGWRVFDIATFVNNQLQQQGKSQRTLDALDAFLEGYQSVRVLSPAELEALPTFVVLRQLWLLGVGARNYANIGLRMFERWVFGMCLPFIREWMAEPFCKAPR